MCIIDIFYEFFLILLWVYAPCSTYDSHIAFWYSIPRHGEWLETILYLTKWIKLIHLSALNSRLIRDITLGEIIICWAIDTLPRTSPKLGQEWYHRNSWKRSHSTLAKNLANTNIVVNFSLCYEFIISLNHSNMRWSFALLICGKDRIFELMKILLGGYRDIFRKRKKYLINYSKIIYHTRSIQKILFLKEKIFLWKVKAITSSVSLS